jgi:maltose alpha-D-glucosyltransferase / alpha-amylase
MKNYLSRDLWYKDAIIYCLDVETFQDSDGDGIGDFRGLSNRLDYLDGLGINCLWLLPFYPTVNRDNGYDVTDYYGIDKRLGTFGDFVDFMYRARERGIRVIIDLVVNHTSDQHPWFQAARNDPSSKFYDYYVWSKDKPADAHEGMVFPGDQESIWTYDDKVQEYYLHRFFSHQPDLNIDNPAVRREICQIMAFWLELGVSGFRLDAAPFLIELKGLDDPEAADPYQFLTEFRRFLSWRRGDSILLAEANVSRDKIEKYFGEGNKLHMLFNFLLNQETFLSLAQKKAEPIAKVLKHHTGLDPANQWANFLRNHDELDLGRLSDEEREFVFGQFAPEESMQLYHRGIRRRLPPMFDDDEDRLRMAYSLMLTLPGTPVLRYGEEIGMGDDLSLPGRESVRTPMQWSSEKNGGFSHAPAERLVRPMIAEKPYGFPFRNVEDQRRQQGSLLNWIERMIRTRKACPEFHEGRFSILSCNQPSVLAVQYQLDESYLAVVHNLSDQPQQVKLNMPKVQGHHLIDLLENEVITRIQDASMALDLGRYGFQWFHLTAPEVY